MKKPGLIISFLLILVTGMAQPSLSLTEGRPSFIYSLPKTVFRIEITTEKVSVQPGIFYRYSERYLATSNVVTEPKTTYRLKSVRIIPVATPDSARTFSFVPDKSSQSAHITVDSQGILCGVNVPSPASVNESLKISLQNEKPLHPELLPLDEEYMMAGSEAKLAEGAAKQIYHIRDSRLSLLTADVDHMPADGESLKTMLDGLNKTEKQLTELFTGKMTTLTETRSVFFAPTKAVFNNVLFRFSELRGLVDASDLSGAPYYCSVIPEKSPVVTADSKSKNATSSLYYIQPTLTTFSISNGVNTLVSGQYYVPQLGVMLPFPEELLKQPKVKISIDNQTGRLLQVE